MEHYYVVTGNEFGVYISSKKNFTPIDKQEAYDYFESVKGEDFGCMLVYVGQNGNEEVLESYYED